MSFKFIFVNIAENNYSDGLLPVRISLHKDFPFGVKRFCPGHNKIDSVGESMLKLAVCG